MLRACIRARLEVSGEQPSWNVRALYASQLVPERRGHMSMRDIVQTPAGCSDAVAAVLLQTPRAALSASVDRGTHTVSSERAAACIKCGHD